MSTVFVTDIGVLATGDISQPVLRDTTLLIDNGLVTEVGATDAQSDLVVSAGGLTAVPGLVDGHVHPTFGEWTPAQNAQGWVHNYLHGGTTTMVSAGELHIPGLDFSNLTPELVISLAIVSRHTTGRERPSKVKMVAGTVLLVPGMTEGHFDRLRAEGVTQAKFIFYNWGLLGDGEAQNYVRWCHERDITVKMHSGGVSRSGASRMSGYDVVEAVQPDIVGHVSGGPIPMPDADIVRVATETDCYLEVCSSMNYRATQVVVEALQSQGDLSRLTLGTDTPGGTGVIPRGMLRNICFLSSVCGIDPAQAVAAATSQTAKAHGLKTGQLAPGWPADLILLGPVTGSSAADGLESFTRGDLPGIAAVFVDGEPVVLGRSEQTPPPARAVKRIG